MLKFHSIVLFSFHETILVGLFSSLLDPDLFSSLAEPGFYRIQNKCLRHDGQFRFFSTIRASILSPSPENQILTFK